MFRPKFYRNLGFVLFLGAPMLTGCAAQVQSTDFVAPDATGSHTLRRPVMVIVRPFYVDTALVQVDQSALAREDRTLNGETAFGKQLEDAEDVQRSIADVLIAQIRAMGLQAELATDRLSAPDTLIIEGQITEVREGNDERRLVLGFGAGRSSVKMVSQMFYVHAAGQRELLQSMSGDSTSGRMPGLAAGAAVSVATDSVASIAISIGAHVLEAPRTAVGREAQRIARKMSADLGQYFLQEGWIPSTAVPTSSF